jgi:hypothetical protein
MEDGGKPNVLQCHGSPFGLLMPIVTMNSETKGSCNLGGWMRLTRLSLTLPALPG